MGAAPGADEPRVGPSPSQSLDPEDTSDVGGILRSTRRYAFGCVLDYLLSHPDCDHEELESWLRTRMNGV